MLIGGLQKLTLIDYPEKVACTVFLIGCNFRCGYCHNPELVLVKKIKKQEVISKEEFFDFLKERKGLLAGVVISGGEPTIHKELPDFIKNIRKFDFLIKLDTNGSNPEILRMLINNKLIDYVAMDIKAPLGLKFQIPNSKLQTNSKSKISKYEQVTRTKIDINKIKKSIEIIKNSGINYEFRTTVVPGIHIKQDIIQLAQEIAPAKKYYLQNFRPEEVADKELRKVSPYSNEYLLEIQKEIEQFFEACEVR